jgi:tRNA A37 threonylcarbamoyladenosine synthetase subunit TsaC/SUA5/YrdC
MSSPVVVGIRDSALHEALDEGRVVALPGVGGYQLAALHEGSGVASLVALVDADVVPYFAVGRMDQAEALTEDWTGDTRRLAIRFWPGPLVMVVGDATAPVRITMPTRRSIRKLCHHSGPMVMASASGPDGLAVSDVQQMQAHFGSTEVAYIVDGGTLAGPGPSVLDCRTTPPSVLYEGALSETFIEGAMLMNARRNRWSRSR